MASIVAAPTPESVIAAPDLPLVEASASTPAHAIAARDEIRMGKAATIDEGVNWLTLSVVAIFHVGALAALFFFSWQRLAVMLVMYVVAINVGIGMCYHRLPGSQMA